MSPSQLVEALYIVQKVSGAGETVDSKQTTTPYIIDNLP